MIRAATAMVVGLLLAAPALAQDAPRAEGSRGEQAAEPGKPDQAPGEDLSRALDLPRAAHRLRERGAPDEDVREALGATREKGLSAAESRDVLDSGAEAAAEHGNIDNFGQFVRSRLGEGLRGQELATAIRAEHQARGKGRPDHAGPPEGKGKAETHGRLDDAGGGKPASAGPPEGRGRTEGAGSTGGQGRTDGAGSTGGQGRTDDAGSTGAEGSGGGSGRGGGQGQQGGSGGGRGGR